MPPRASFGMVLGHNKVPTSPLPHNMPEPSPTRPRLRTFLRGIATFIALVALFSLFRITTIKETNLNVVSIGKDYGQLRPQHRPNSENQNVDVVFVQLQQSKQDYLSVGEDKALFQDAVQTPGAQTPAPAAPAREIVILYKDHLMGNGTVLGKSLGMSLDLQTLEDKARADYHITINKTLSIKPYTWPAEKDDNDFNGPMSLEGTYRHPSGMVINSYHDVCMGAKKFIFVARDEEHYHELSYCCFSGLPVHTLHNCSSHTLNQCHIILTRPKMLSFELWRRENVTSQGLLVLEGNGYWLYTVGVTEHIGHMVNRLLQFFHATTERNLPKFDYFLSNRASHPRGLHLREMADIVLGPYLKRSWFRDRMLSEGTPLVCARRLYELDYGLGEQLFFTRQQAERWQAFAKTHFYPKDFEDSLCPPPVAMVLRREEGSGMRKILNYDVVERVLRANGITSYRNVTVGETDSTDTHVRLFSGFGLLIASHSSQLKNLIFSRRNAIVMEARGTPPGYMQPSPFALGMDKLGLIYEESVGHIPDYSSCPESHGCRNKKKYKTDYWLDEAIFDLAVKNALRRQAEAGCGHIWRQQDSRV